MTFYTGKTILSSVYTKPVVRNDEDHIRLFTLIKIRALVDAQEKRYVNT